MSNTFLVTGVTGFLGKVVLSELLRRRDELKLAKIFVLVRARRHQPGSSRFWTHIAASACFAGQGERLRAHVEVIDGELTRAGCGITHAQRERVLKETTHIIHCAASVDFDRPLEEAATSNITSARQVLALAQACRHRVHMVATSTAYVHPHRTGPIPEALVELPRQARDIYADIARGHDEATLLRETQHANTYTYTKCIAEHLLVDEHDTTPLSIVRPSIISASVARPAPGWIDSRAAFAGFVCTIGSGVLRVIDGLPTAKLDLVPVDVVAATLIDTALAVPDAGEVPIVHAVAGPQRCAKVGPTCEQIVGYFRRHPIGRRPRRVHLQPRDRAFGTRLALAHELPLQAHAASRALLGDAKGGKRSRRIAETLRVINRVFPYFTHHTFAFTQAEPRPEMDGFRPDAYVELVCRGARTHLMQRSQRQAQLLGERSASRHSRAPLPLALLGNGVRKLFGQITYDELALQQVAETVPPNSDIVLVANHPSRIDGLLIAALVHARPDLRWLPINELDTATYVAASEQAPLSLRKRFKQLCERTLLYPQGESARTNVMFLEQRGSTSRRIGALNTQALKLLSHERRPKVLVPLTLSYERLPEEVLQLRAGAHSEPLALDGPRLARWLWQVYRGEVRLGQVHISAGEPVLLRPETKTEALAETLRLSWQRHQVAFRPALEAFLARHPTIQLDVGALEQLLAERGVRVLAGAHSSSPRRGLIQPSLEHSWRHSWLQGFWAELTARYPACVALSHAAGPMASESQASALGRNAPLPAHATLLHTLAAEISADFVAALQGLARLLAPREQARRSDLMQGLAREVHVGDVAWLASALELALASGLVEEQPEGIIRRVGSRLALRELLSSCALGPDAWIEDALAGEMGTQATRAPKRRRRPAAPGDAARTAASSRPIATK